MTRRNFLSHSMLAPLALSAGASRTRSLAVTNVSFVDVGGRVLHDQTVLVRGDRIAGLGSGSAVRVPADAQHVAGRGRFLIPGLWDMHVHLSAAGPHALPVLLAAGVTAVRDMGGLLNDLDRWRAGIEAGTLAGPRIFRAGPIVNAKAFNQFQIPVENAAEARGAVRALHKAGVDFIKVHAATGRDAYFAIAEETKRLGIHFAGHVPRAISPAEASDAGQASLEHIGTLFDGVLAAGIRPDDLPDAITRFRSEGAPELFARFAKNRTSFTPTVVIERASIHLTDPSLPARNPYASKQARALTQFVVDKYKDQYTPAYIARQTRQFAATLPLVPLMQRSGVRLLAGTDMGSSLLLPGFSLHEELALLVENGLSPLEALNAATQAPAQILEKNDLGSIQEGKLADLVLLDANPLEDIRNTQKIRAVIFGGKLYDRTALDNLLHAAQAAVRDGE